MKRKRINPHTQIIFRQCTSVYVFVEDKNACKATWAVHASKIRVTFLDVRDRGRTKNNLRGGTVGLNLMRTIISLASSCLTVGRHRNQFYALRPYGEIAANATRLRKSAMLTERM